MTTTQELYEDGEIQHPQLYPVFLTGEHYGFDEEKRLCRIKDYRPVYVQVGDGLYELKRVKKLSLKSHNLFNSFMKIMDDGDIYLLGSSSAQK